MLSHTTYEFTNKNNGKVLWVYKVVNTLKHKVEQEKKLASETSGVPIEDITVKTVNNTKYN